MIEIILLIAGTVLLIKGNVKATATSEIPKRTGRVLGVILIAPLIIDFLAGLVASFLGTPLSDASLTNLLTAQRAVVVLALLIAIIFLRKPIIS